MNIPLRQYWSLLSRYLKPQWARGLRLAVLLLGAIGLQLLNPQILRDFIDMATSGAPMAALVSTAILFGVVALLNQGLSVVNTYLSETVAWAATNGLRFDLVAHCLALDQSFHKSRTPGELVERVDGDVSALANFFSQFLIHVVGNLLLLAGVLALLFREDWRVGVGLSLYAAVGLATLIRIRTLAIPHWGQVRQMSATFSGFLGELLAATEDLRANGAESYALHRFHEIIRRWFPTRLKADLAGSGMWMAEIGLFALGNALALGLSAYLWRTQAITVGTVYLIFHYTQLARSPIAHIRSQIADLQRAEASIRRVQELQRTRCRLREGVGAALPEGALPVAFRDVSFSYDEQETVLHHLSFELGPGRVLGLLGRTGSGKTTLARLLLRLYDPDSGEIRVGGLPLSAARLRHVRERVALVTQEVQLFKATVRDNLTFFDPAIPDKQLLAVLDDLGLSPWLRSLPNGLDSELEAGGGLSAGQAQLLAFARVFLADPGLVILDEASSRLDPATERLIDRAVARLLANRTSIVIAHRLATVQRADEILILEGGRVLEAGDRAALAADPSSHFHRLLQTGLEEVLT